MEDKHGREFMNKLNGRAKELYHKNVDPLYMEKRSTYINGRGIMFIKEHR